MTRPRVRLARVRGQRDGDIPLPARATSHSAGADLHAAIEGEHVLRPGERLLVPTGFAMEIQPGFEGQIRPRSGLARDYGVSLANGVGTIDADFRGEVQVILQNSGARAFTLRRGDRVAQLVIAPVVQPDWEEVEDVRELSGSGRGAGGFGHSGTSPQGPPIEGGSA